MTDAIRTPDELTEGLPDFPFAPHFREVEGFRMAHLDEGDGPPVVFWHGEPTWSFLWRKVIPPVRDAGFRCIAPDLPGFGRSDKPVDLDWYTYDRHTAFGRSLVEDLDLRGATFVVHDWGGPVGLRVAIELRDAPTASSSSTRACSPAAREDERRLGALRVRRAHAGPADVAARRRRDRARPARRRQAGLRPNAAGRRGPIVDWSRAAGSPSDRPASSSAPHRGLAYGLRGDGRRQMVLNVVE